MFLEIRNIKKSFGQGDSFVEVLKGINLEINRGEFCVLLGPSGSRNCNHPQSYFEVHEENY